MLREYGELGYLAAVALGVVCAFIAARKVTRDDAVPPDIARRVRVAGLVGGVLGAYSLQLPADLLQLSVPSSQGLMPIGGRTVLGGLLGGWIAVEITKKRAGFVGATGDRFAFPLSIALIFGRLGCVLQGCCEGVLIPDGHPFARVGRLVYAEARFPATLVEAYFHSAAAILILVSLKRGWLHGRLLSVYLACYALVRFSLEFVRAHPAAALGLTYYQWLCVPLFALAAGTWWARRHTEKPAPRSTLASDKA